MVVAEVEPIDSESREVGEETPVGSGCRRREVPSRLMTYGAQR